MGEGGESEWQGRDLSRPFLFYPAILKGRGPSGFANNMVKDERFVCILFLGRKIMHIAILTFQGFNELDSFIALGILNRIKKPDWRVTLACPSPTVTSMNGVTVRAQSSFEEAANADAVIIGSGSRTREIVETPALMAALKLDPKRQLIGAQCSGTLIMARLGLLGDIPACTDLLTRPWVQAVGVAVVDQPFYARGNIATAGGCLASQYLAAWIIACTEGEDAAMTALHYVAPVGEKEDYVRRAMNNIVRYLPGIAAK